MGLKAEISHLPHKRKSNHLQHSLLFSLHFTLSLSFSLSLSLYPPQQLVGYLQTKLRFSLSHVSNSGHESWFRFRVSSRYSATHFKSKSDFPCLSLLSSDSKPSSLSLINGSLPSLLYSLCSLLISKPLLFILKQILLFLYIKMVAGCCCRRLTAHLTSSSSLHGSSQALSLGCLVSDQVKKFPFSSLFFGILCL